MSRWINIRPKSEGSGTRRRKKERNKTYVKQLWNTFYVRFHRRFVLKKSTRAACARVSDILIYIFIYIFSLTTFYLDSNAIQFKCFSLFRFSCWLFSALKSHKISTIFQIDFFLLFPLHSSVSFYLLLLFIYVMQNVVIFSVFSSIFLSKIYFNVALHSSLLLSFRSCLSFSSLYSAL